MGAPLSITRRPLSSQSLRLCQPMPWADGLSFAFAASSALTTITASSTTHAKGSWSQLVASTASRSAGVMIYAANNTVTSTNTSLLLDLGVGAAGSEAVVIPNIALGGANGFRVFVPIRIPSGSRVAARCQSVVASRTISIAVMLFDSPNADRLPASVDSIGVDASTSQGTAMSGSSGTWVQITPATSADYQSLVLVPSASSTAGAAGSVRLSLGIGAAGAETEVGFFNGGAGTSPSISDTSTSGYGGFSTAGLFVPAGSRIAVRHNLAANPDRISACVLGVPYV